MNSSDDLDWPGINPIGGPLRAIGILTLFAAITVPLMPVQYLLLKMAPRLARSLPQHYHRVVCRLLGIRLTIEGAVAADRPVLVAANHVSWLDIPVLSSIAPLSFIAKREVGTWPVVSTLARLQRTVFVDRERRTNVGKVTSEMSDRLAGGDTLVLFAEGTSTDGNRVMPFKSALFAAAFGAPDAGTSVQTLSLTYTRLHGVPIGRADRHRIGWYGDMEMADHAWYLLQAGPLDVRIVIGEPVPLAEFETRKALASHTEKVIRNNVVETLRGRYGQETGA